ncbi:choline-phosphate cytidylyltransferase A-like [Actinia tenebrosa]|uniref:choline-phosphate cytidylyltransferase n=1 Tax=Actinia tenebrosa TaxID=6105 RepID=A0A6P8HFC0_ACTTE|nr:choline-phosphate cytidylyltransferase A-like [Actinia tenebrosa]
MSSPKAAKADNTTRKRKRKSSSSESEENGPSKRKQRPLAPREPAVYFDPENDSSDLEDIEPISFEDAKNGKATRPIRVYADGIYDLFHFGHARALMQAKLCFPTPVYLMVGVCSDELTHKFKGFTVMTDEERYQSLLHSRYVDEVIKDAPWLISKEFLDLHKIDFVAHDDFPYKSAGAEDVYKDIKAMGKFVATQRTEGISTSDIIARVVKDYDVYLRRNLARGYTAKELNVGFMKEKEVLVRNKFDDIKGKITDKSQELLEKWEEKSRDFISRFIDIFGRDGHLDRLIGRGKDKIVGAGRRIKHVLSPNPYADPEYYEEVSPSRLPAKQPRLSFEPEMSDDSESDGY